MLRLSAPMPSRLSQADVLRVHFGGAEANVAFAMAQLGAQSAFVTKFPDEHALAQRAIDELRGGGVETGWISRGGDRLGTYFIESGAGNRPAVVLYDRANSSFATAAPNDFDFSTIFVGANAVHLTGITSALSDSCRALNLAAAAAARKAGALVSFDINYRSKLWSRAEAADALSEILPLVDLCFASEGDVATLFGIEDDNYFRMARRLQKRFPNLRGVAGTLREPFVGTLAALRGALVWENSAAESRRHEFAVVDRIGAGDAFAAGVLLGLLENRGPELAVEMGAALGALKHSVDGDYCRITRAELDALLQHGDATGRVQR